jgi:hypothetical protein
LEAQPNRGRAITEHGPTTRLDVVAFRMTYLKRSGVLLAFVVVIAACASNVKGGSAGSGGSSSTSVTGGGAGGTGSDAGLDGDACVPTTCAELTYDCGTWPDGCGAMLDCGSCNPPEICGGSVAGHCGQ